MTFFGNTAVPTITLPKKKHSLLPVLTVVFLASYGLMTLLIVEQGHAIQQQHNLIQVLMGDSRELWALKGKVLTDKSAQPKDQTQSPAQPLTQTPMTRGQAPSLQTPSTQAPSTRTPSTQVPKHPQSRAGKDAKPLPQDQVPPVPASDLTDQRRVLITL